MVSALSSALFAGARGAAAGRGARCEAAGAGAAATGTAAGAGAGAGAGAAASGAAGAATGVAGAVPGKPGIADAGWDSAVGSPATGLDSATATGASLLGRGGFAFTSAGGGRSWYQKYPTV